MIQVSIESRRVCYKLDIKYRVSLIRGDSATGKTALLHILQHLNTKVSSPYPIVTNLEYGSLSALESLRNKPRHIIILDEDFPDIDHELLYQFIQETDHIWIIFSRKFFKDWSYPADAIYRLVISGNTLHLSPIYCLADPCEMQTQIFN